MADEIGKAGTEPRSLLQLSVASVGMTVVALVCALAGLFYGLRKIPSFDLVSYVLWFGCLVLPYYLSREGSVEEPLRSSRDRKNNIFFPLVVFAFVSLLALSRTAISNIPANIIWGDHIYDGLVFLMGMALVPFAYLGIHTQWLLSKSDEAARDERAFKNKVLLPAFATCLVSFTFGWAISHRDVAWWVMAIPIVIVVALKTLASRKGGPSLGFLIYFFLACIIGAFIPVIRWNSEIGKVIIIGIILTFAMGVAEVCKRVVRFPEASRGANDIDGETFWFYLAGANWSSVVFPLLLCFLPFLIYELPILPIVIILAFQYIHWHYFFPEKNSRPLFWLNVLLGFLLPVLLVLQYVYPLPPIIIKADAITDLSAVFGMALAAAAIFITFKFSDQATKFFNNATDPNSYLEYDNCFFLFVASVVVIAILIFGLATIFDVFTGAHQFREKATETIIYLIVLVVGIAFTWWNRRNNMMRKSPRPKNTEPHPEGHQRSPLEISWWSKQILLILNVGRLPVGLIASSAVLFIEALYTTHKWWLLLIHAAPICFVTMAGFVINDIFDIEKDRLAERPKLVAIGLIPVGQARVFAWVLICLAVVTAFLARQAYSSEVIELALAGVIIYSILAKYLPTLKGLATAILCCTPFAYASQLAEINFPVWLYFFITTFIMGRELLLDVRDFQSDRSAGLRTLVWYFGLPTSRIVGWVLMITSLIVGASNAKGVGEYLFVAALLSLGLCGGLYARNESLGLGWSRLTLLIGVIAVAFSLY